ncbi:MAG: hypothetical protein V3T59_02685 [Desulfobacterales bacterium]
MFIEEKAKSLAELMVYHREYGFKKQLKQIHLNERLANLDYNLEGLKMKDNANTSRNTDQISK